MKLDELARLRKLLLQMETDMGLNDFSENEVNVLCAASEISESHSIIESSKLKKHELINHMKPATFHRALRSLLEKNLMKYYEKSKSKRYIFNK